MAKRTAKTADPQTVTITYDLFDLPTAQHKAGLAGLLLQIDSMHNRGKAVPAYHWDTEAPTTRVHVEFTKETTASLFDDLYDAAWVEGPPREKPFYRGKGDARKEVPAIRRVPITKTDKKGNKKVIEGYVYLELTPALATLTHFLPAQGEWVKLWRDLIWNVIRDSKKKAPFIQRAAAKAQPDEAALRNEDAADIAESQEDEKSKGDGSSWSDLVKHYLSLHKNTFALGNLSGALLLGAHTKNAEIIPFSGRLDQNLLLHFWPLAAMVYVPRFVDRDGNSHIGRRDKDDKAQHFCVVIPDVANLERFATDYKQLLAGLDQEVALYRPKEALIDIPAEGGISFIEHLARLAPQIAAGAETRYSISGVDYLHVSKEGNNAKFLSTGRIEAHAYLAEDYRGIAGGPGQRPPYANPLFRRGLILALLNGEPWYKPFGDLFAEWPHHFFVSTDDSPKLSWFWVDARKKLQERIQAMPTDPRSVDSALDADDVLMALIHRLTRTYLTERAKQKSGIDPDRFREGEKINWEKLPKDYHDARRAAGESLFLEFRSRREQAFIDHFAQTFFATKQYVSEDQYTEIGRELLHQPEKVKTLTLMALSANS